MADWKERLVQEKSDLDETLTKLANFMGSDKFLSLDIIGQYLLRMQRSHMMEYSSILEARIAHHKG